ncbi:MAG: hypothetical protein ACREVS_02750 [Burkholderiales bacterium]|jgi:hypothetical protein
MMKLDSIVTTVLVALALVGALAMSFSATAATPEAQSGDAYYFKGTGGVPPQ